MTLLHGTAVVLGRAGLLLRGPSGAGKSDLALRLIDGGARLVADDQVRLERSGNELRMTAPATIAGLIEVRGIGLMHLPRAAEAPLRLVCDLVPREAVERLPENTSCELLDVTVPRVALCAFDSSTPAKLRLALKAMAGDELATEAALQP